MVMVGIGCVCMLLLLLVGMVVKMRFCVLWCIWLMSIGEVLIVSFSLKLGLVVCICCS